MREQKISIIYDSRGPSGNIYSILAVFRNEMRKRRQITEYNGIWERVHSARSYKEALEIIGEKAELIDVSG